MRQTVNFSHVADYAGSARKMSTGFPLPVIDSRATTETMPSSSAKQARTMAIASANPEFAHKVGIPVAVADEYHAADKRKRNAELVRRALQRRQAQAAPAAAK